MKFSQHLPTLIKQGMKAKFGHRIVSTCLFLLRYTRLNSSSFLPPNSPTIAFPPQTRPVDVLAEWTSGPNGVADVQLTFLKNHKFIFYMGIQPSLGETDIEIDEVRSKGHWRHKDGCTILKFRNKDLKLEVLFDESSVLDGRCEITGKHKVQIGGFPEKIKIWDVWCTRKADMPS